MSSPLVVGLLTAAAVIAAIKVISGWSPVKWIFHRLVREPAEQAVISVVQPELTQIRGETARILHEVTFNDGSSLKDLVRDLQEVVAKVSNRLVIFEEAFDVYTKKEVSP